MPYSGGVRGYRRILERVVADGYDGFTFTTEPLDDDDISTTLRGAST